MSDRFVANISLHHMGDGYLIVSAYVLGVPDPNETMRKIEFNASAPDSSTDALDWLRQALAAATEAC